MSTIAMSTDRQQVREAGVMEKAFTVLVLTLMTGAFLNLSLPDPADQANGVLGWQIVWSLIYLIIFALLLRRCKGFIQAFFQPRLLVLLLSLTLISTLWSEAPSTTFRRSVALFCTSFFGLYFAMRYDNREKMKLLSRVCWIAVIGSLIFGTFGLGHSVDNLEGSWYGLYVQRNGLGRMMVFSLIVFLVVGRVEPHRKPLMWFGMVVAFILMLLSQSQTAIVSAWCLLGFAFACAPNLRRSVRRAILTIASLGCATLAAVYWAFTHLSLMTGWLHRDKNLSGRLYVWVLGVTMALRKPWLGYGYSAFWLGPHGPSARISAALNWAAPNGHNGLLDLTLDLGLVGLTIFLLGFFIYTFRVLVAFRKQSAPEYLWPLLLLCFLVLMNLTQSALASDNSLFWVLYTATVFGVAEGVREKRPQTAKSTAPNDGYWRGVVPAKF
jgi:exopolysaccharide production protein ExoQ